jgi:dTDP-4-dehydrorhamnose 3,5-epimerase-like enzyme
LSQELPIHDLFIRSIPITENRCERRWLALQESDHLLRRFALAEVVRADPDRQEGMRLRSVADEVWALIEGRVEFRWHDLRPGSPTQGSQHRLVCSDPTLVLAPFGVAFGFLPLDGPALLLRLATHVDGLHEGDRDLEWESPA